MSAITLDSRLLGEQKAGDFVFAVEVWRAGELQRRYLTADAHGAIYASASSTFGCLAWSPDNGQLLYAAESKPRGGVSWWDFASKQKEKDGGSCEWKLADDAPVPGHKVCHGVFFCLPFRSSLRI